MKQSSTSSATPSMTSSSQQKQLRTGPTRPTSSSDELLGSGDISSPAGELRNLLDELEKALDNLFKQLANLENRLDPVLQPRTTADSEFPVHAAYSPLGTQLSVRIGHVTASTNLVQSLLARLAT